MIKFTDKLRWFGLLCFAFGLFAGEWLAHITTTTKAVVFGVVVGCISWYVIFRVSRWLGNTQRSSGVNGVGSRE